MEIRKIHWLGCTLSAVLALAFASTGPALADPAAGLLAASRAALGGSALERVTSLKIENRGQIGGLPSTDTAWQQIGKPAFSDFYAAGPLKGGQGYDGTDAWSQDGSGLVWVDGGNAGRAQTIAQAFASSYALWMPDRGGARVKVLGSKSADGRAYDVLMVMPPGAAIGYELWLDPATHLPARITQTVGPDTSVSTFSDYRPVDGLMIPYATTNTGGGNEISSKVVNATANPAEIEAQLQKPESNVHDFSIEGGSRTSVPFDLVENHVYLKLSLNGKGPYTFVLDTGGANIVDPGVAKEIGAIGQGAFQGGGVGATTESLSFANVDTMKIGNAVVKNQLFAVAPTRMGFGMAGGHPIDGLIGFEVLARFTTTFDYGANTVIFAMPGDSAAPADADIVPFVLDGRQPQFNCGINGIPTLCTVDTGSRDSISLFTPFIKAHPLVQPQRMAQPGVNGFGFGGPAYGRLGRLRSLTFGKFDLPEIIGDFSTQEKGAFAQPFIGGNVGGGVWKRFSMTLDYSKQTMAFEPNAAFATRDSYERAGVFLINRAGKFTVIDVRPGTPAEAAGIQRGDVIASIDGRPTAEMSLQAVRETFFKPAGTVLHVGLVNRTGTRRTVVITLADIV